MMTHDDQRASGSDCVLGVYRIILKDGERGSPKMLLSSHATKNAVSEAVSTSPKKKLKKVQRGEGKLGSRHCMDP